MAARRPFRPAALLLALTFLLGLAFQAVGQSDPVAERKTDASEQAARLRSIQRMSPAERQRLKQALARFRKLDDTKRAALREKARKLGEDRLRALGGRDIQPLQERHVRVRKEVKKLKKLLRFEFATRGLTDAERQFMEYELSRQFHQSVQRQILAPDGQPFDVQRMRKMTPQERRDFYRERMSSWLIAELDADELETFRTATPREQNKIRKEKMRAFRDRHALPFVSNFQANFLTKFQQLAQPKRDRRVRAFQRRARWYEMSRLLEREVKVKPDVLRRLRQLPADDWAKVRDRYEQVRDEPLHRRQLAMEQLIDELHGKASSDKEARLRDQRERKARRAKRKNLQNSK